VIGHRSHDNFSLFEFACAGATAATPAAGRTRSLIEGSVLMKNRQVVRGLLVTAALVVAVWAAGAGRASAEEPPPPQPPTCDEIDGPSAAPLTVPPVPLDCTVATATFTPENNSWTYFFDANNSIKITTQVNFAFDLTVEMIVIDQSDYALRVPLGSPFHGSQCWPTEAGECVYYRVHGELVPAGAYEPGVDYIIGFTTPGIAAKPNLMMLRSSSESFPVPYDGIDPFSTFDQNVTAGKILKKYLPGDDPGVGGFADSFSDYILAFPAPVSKTKPPK
jgi:hypothetical protein